MKFKNKHTITNNAIGDRFVIRERNIDNSSVYTNINIELDEAELFRNSWTKTGCVNAMGQHYIRYFYGSDVKDCDHFYPIGLMFINNILVGYFAVVMDDSYDNLLRLKTWNIFPNLQFPSLSTFGTMNHFDSIMTEECGKRPFVSKHMYFYTPNKIVCDEDVTIETISFSIIELLVNIKNNGPLFDFNYLYMIGARIFSQVPFVSEFYFNYVPFRHDFLWYIDYLPLKNPLTSLNSLTNIFNINSKNENHLNDNYSKEHELLPENHLNESAIPIFMITICLFISSVIYCYTMAKKRKNKKQLYQKKNDYTYSAVVDMSEPDNVDSESELITSFHTFSTVPKNNYVSLCWKDISYSIHDRKILDNICGYVESGNILVMLGPSGCGKTTLIEILCNLRRDYSGNIYYNGQSKSKKFHGGNIMGFENKNNCYISQDITLPTYLTVRENIEFNAHLKTRKNVNHIQNAVNDIIESLGLDDCQHTMIGNIFNKHLSYGEKKRCVIGMELVNEPMGILCMDEILSNLDSTSAYYLFKIVIELKNRGYCIILSIHQPSIRMYKMMVNDKNCNNINLMLLNEGKCVYFGEMKDSVTYFKKHGYECPPSANPLLYFLDILNNIPSYAIKDEINNNEIDDEKQNNHQKEDIGGIFDKHQSSDVSNTITNLNNKYVDRDTMKLNTKSVSILDEIYVLTKINFISDCRNVVIYYAKLFTYLLLSLALGLIYYDINNTKNAFLNRIGYLMYLVNFLNLACFTSIEYFTAQRALFISQYMNNHFSIISYVISNLLSELPWTFISSLIVTVTIIFMINTQQNDLTFNYCAIFYLITFSLTFCVNSFAVFLSSLTSKYTIILSLMAAVVGIFVMFSPCLIVYEDIPEYLRWIYHISFFTYSYQGFVFIDSQNQYEIVEHFGFENVNVNICILILFGMGVFYQCLFYTSLKYWVFRFYR